MAQSPFRRRPRSSNYATSTMTNPIGGATEASFNVTVRPPMSPEPELQRGRKRRRDFLEVNSGRTAIPSVESATCRGRCRYRSSSRYLDMSSLSRPTSQHRMTAGHHCRNTSASPSPSHRKLIRITQLARECLRSRPASRSRSPYPTYTELGTAPSMAKYRLQRAHSRSQAHLSKPVTFEMAPHGDKVGTAAIEAFNLPPTTYEIVLSGGISTAQENGEQG
ncbi:hypothetical protein F5B17DRAFT_404620 [Nemania serpens]|nr:hypothetical protein F5B17DRAFT_404620 [Nemania serpens]